MYYNVLHLQKDLSKCDTLHNITLHLYLHYRVQKVVMHNRLSKLYLLRSLFKQCKMTRPHMSDNHLTVSYQMFHWTVCPRGSKVTSVAFVYLFSTVCFQMSLQLAWLREGIVTLAASVCRLLPTVCFQMSLQIACLRGFKVTLAALVWLFSTVCFKMFP